MADKRQRSDSFMVAALLAVAGGVLDSYTYLCRGGVFANAQTGNIVLFGIYASEGNMRGAVSVLIPITAFAAGVLVTDAIHAGLPSGRDGAFHWRHAALLLEMAMLLAAALIPAGRMDRIVTTIISAVCAVQVQSFRKVHGYQFASTMCTGNLRSGTEALRIYLATGDQREKERFICCYGVILFFIIGAFTGAIVSSAHERMVIPLAMIFELSAFAVMTYWGKREHADRS